MAFEDTTQAAREAAARAVSLLGVAGLTGTAHDDGVVAADALTVAAEIVVDNRTGFSDAMIDFLRHVAREGEAESLDRELRYLLGQGSIEEDAGVDTVLRAAMIAGLAIVTVRRNYAARQDAAAARATFAAFAEPEIERTGQLLGYAAHVWLADLVGKASVILSKLAADRAPLVRVETGVSMPSSRLAYDLYGDPDRGAELVTRNKVATPIFMPVRIEALAS